MGKTSEKCFFETDKRIRLGIWGLGRGASFARMCAALNIDVVAGCDTNAEMRDRFTAGLPDALVTADEEEFLDSDIDAVLIATYCPDHGGHAIRCIEAGKHVLSEVTAFHTPAEGVQLVEAVETSGRVYNLAENYPFAKARLYLADRWREGLFGDLIYAENEYNHDSRRPLSFRYNGGGPVQPGWSLHGWRSWNHQHYYCTHSLGPIMHITGGRPAQVVSLPGENSMAANVSQVKASGISTVAPSIVKLDNGGLVRNFMGSTPRDTHLLRLWGTKAAAEYSGELTICVGGKGTATPLRVSPQWPEHGALADAMGHGGGDFWVLYYFAREILFDEPAFWNVYRSADVTLTGIFAYRSALEEGVAYDIPDFRDPSARAAFRNDTKRQQAYDWKNGPFPESADRDALTDFTAVMSDLIETHATTARATIDGLNLRSDLADPGQLKPVFQQFVEGFDEMRITFARAREIAAAYPDSDGAQMLEEMLDLAQPSVASDADFLARVKQELSQLG